MVRGYEKLRRGGEWGEGMRYEKLGGVLVRGV